MMSSVKKQYTKCPLNIIVRRDMEHELTLEKLADILKIVLSREGSKEVTCSDKYGVSIILGYDEVFQSYSINYTLVDTLSRRRHIVT